MRPRRPWLVAALVVALLACEQQKLPPIRGLSAQQVAAEQMNRAFAPSTVTLLSASPRLMPAASRQISLADGTIVVALFDRQAPTSDEADLPAGSPLVFAVRPGGAVIPVPCPASLIAATAQPTVMPLMVPHGDGVALLLRSSFPGARSTLYLVDLTAGAVIETAEAPSLIGRGVSPDRFVLHDFGAGQARVVRREGDALATLASVPLPSTPLWMDEPAPGVVAWVFPLLYRRSDAAADVPLPSSLFGPFDGASQVQREPGNTLLIETGAGVVRWSPEGDGAVTLVAPLVPFPQGYQPAPSSAFARTPAVLVGPNPYQPALSTPVGQAVRSLLGGAFVVRPVQASPCAAVSDCERLGEVFTRDVLGDGDDAHAVQMVYPWLDGALQRMVVVPASFSAAAAGAGGGAGAGGAGGDSGAAGADPGGSSGSSGQGGAGGESGSSGQSGASGAGGAETCPAACPGACGGDGLCAPTLVDPGPVLALSSSEVGNVGVLRSGSAGVIFKETPDQVATLVPSLSDSALPGVVLSNADLYLATGTGVFWQDAFGGGSPVLIAQPAFRLVGVNTSHVYTHDLSSAIGTVQRTQRPHGDAQVAACLPQKNTPALAIDVRRADGGLLVGRDAQVFRYDGVVGGLNCSATAEGTPVLTLPAGVVTAIVYDPSNDRFVATGSGEDFAVTTSDSFGGSVLALAPGRGAAHAVAVRDGAVFYAQAGQVPGLPAEQVALVEVADGAARPLALPAGPVVAIAATPSQLYWAEASGALYRVPR